MYSMTLQLDTAQISNDNMHGMRDPLQEFIAAQDMFSPEEAAQILRQSMERGTPIVL